MVVRGKHGRERLVDDPEFESAIDDELQEMVGQYQKVYDELVKQHGGEPAEAIKPILHERWSEVEGGGDLTDPDLTELAEAIARREEIIFEAEGGD
jgi:hypothetical protein